MSNEKESNKQQENTKSQNQEIKKTPTVDTKNGIVVDCTLLNVRQKPKNNADIKDTIAKGTSVIIDQAKSTDEFYKITTKDNVTGFCMKQFIRVC